MRPSHSCVPTLVLSFAIILFVASATAPPGLARMPLPAGPFVGEEDCPQPSIPEGASSNIDFVSKMLMGTIRTHSMAYNPVRKHLCMGFGSTFAVLNVADMARPAVVGWVDLGPSENIRGIAYPGDGDYVFAAAAGAGLHKINVANPATPTVVATWSGMAVEVFTVGTTAYVSSESGGLYVVDTATMTTATYYDTPGNARDAFVLGTYAYVADGDSLQILNITTVPPTAVGSLPTTQCAGVWALPTYPGTRVLVADQGSDSDPDLRIIDATDPTSPTEVGNLVGSGMYDYGYDVATDETGSTAYLAGYWGGLIVVDTSDPANLVEQARYSTNDAAEGILMIGTDALVAAGTSLEFIDTAPAIPELKGRFLCDTGNRVTTSGNYAFVGGGRGMTVIDVSIPQRPRPLARQGMGMVYGIDVSGSRAYTVDQYTLRVYDVSSPSSPTEIGSFYMGERGRGIQISGHYAFVATESTGLRTFDVSSPGTITEAGHLDLTSGGYDLALSETYAFVPDGDGFVRVIDVSNPASPALVTTIGSSVTAVRTHVSGCTLYVSGESGVEVFDITNPTAAAWLATHPMDSGAYDVAVSGGLAYVAARSWGLKVLDVDPPWSPSEVGSYDTDTFSPGVDFRDGYVFLTDSDNGAYIMHHTQACYDSYEPNDFFASAQEISAGAVYTSKVCTSGDLDYYQITLAGGTLSLTMEPPVTKNYDLFLFDSEQNLVAASTREGQGTELVSLETAGGTYYVLVKGSDGTQYSGTATYTLWSTFAACPAPTQALLIYTGRKDVNNDVILDILDPNQPSVVTGYNVYRATVPNPETWPLHAANVRDADAGTANVQYIDLGSHSGGTYYYLVKATNAGCGAVGP